MNLAVNVLKPRKRPMTLKARVKAPLLLVGDVIIFYCSLILLLFIRYGEFSIFDLVFYVHVVPFSIAALAWIIMFYIGGLYENFAFKNTPLFKRRFFTMVGLCGIFLIMLLYFVPQFGIAPKVNFFIFMGIYAASGYAWRFSFNALLKLRARDSRSRILLVGSSEAARRADDYIAANPQMGYEIAMRMQNGLEDSEDFVSGLIKRDISVIVIPALERDPRLLRMLYAALLSGIEVMRLSDFYEQLFEKVPVAELDDAWLLENLPRGDSSYQTLGRLAEGLAALLLIIILLPLMFICILAIMLSSRGPVVYRQKRVGQYESIFNLYKFRSMYADSRNPDAESTAATWTVPGDDRITTVGKFLRASHLDELPQLFNILVGSMSFIGPRPERPEFTAELEQKIPYYELRYLLKPGITGWAQLNYKYGASVEDAVQKLQYDIYYLKRRSFAFDMKIALKTLKKFFV